ncbi:hypothetical protein CBR_g11104 [Chara braunii]|uniref:Uncharacterized protein n=1 Tax=Chara braunii TaxID=69332 RepID=A0A388KQ28_CHABU|nr:hypothetical protein CBR_g11104 [Chara braunii]|eukprot:GBG72171.1 hypothetical protein CBR_g11104 [Chara braunii]
MDGLYASLRAVIKSADELENIDALIDEKLGEHSAKLNKVDTFLTDSYLFVEVKREEEEEEEEEDRLLLAANAFVVGHDLLLKVGNTVTSGLTAKTVLMRWWRLH